MQASVQPGPTRAVCRVADLVPGSGVAVLVDDEQVALFYPVPDGEAASIYALSNYDPIGGANVLSRGIIGDVGGALVVASPLYKQHFRLEDGVCVEQPDVVLRTYPVQIVGEHVMLGI